MGFDLKIASQIFFTLVIAVVVGYLFFGMATVSQRNTEQQTQKIKEVIDKALVQCYALEGSFPAEVHYLTKYGIIFEDAKYIYDYDMFGVNYVPQVTVLTRD